MPLARTCAVWGAALCYAVGLGRTDAEMCRWHRDLQTQMCARGWRTGTVQTAAAARNHKWRSREAGLSADPRPVVRCFALALLPKDLKEVLGVTSRWGSGGLRLGWDS